MAADVYWQREFEGGRAAFMAQPWLGERLADEIPDPHLELKVRKNHAPVCSLSGRTMPVAKSIVLFQRNKTLKKKYKYSDDDVYKNDAYRALFALGTETA